MFANVQTTSGSLLEGEADRDVRRVARDIFADSLLFGMQIMELRLVGNIGLGRLAGLAFRGPSSGARIC